MGKSNRIESRARRAVDVAAGGAVCTVRGFADWTHDLLGRARAAGLIQWVRTGDEMVIEYSSEEAVRVFAPAVCADQVIRLWDANRIIYRVDPTLRTSCSNQISVPPFRRMCSGASRIQIRAWCLLLRLSRHILVVGSPSTRWRSSPGAARPMTGQQCVRYTTRQHSIERASRRSVRRTEWLPRSHHDDGDDRSRQRSGHYLRGNRADP